MTLIGATGTLRRKVPNELQETRCWAERVRVNSAFADRRRPVRHAASRAGCAAAVFGIPPGCVYLRQLVDGRLLTWGYGTQRNDDDGDRGQPGIRPRHRSGAACPLPQRARRAGQDRRRSSGRHRGAPCHRRCLPHREAAPQAGAPRREDRPRQGRHRSHRDRLRRAHRRRDAGGAAVVERRRGDRGHTPAPPVLLHLQDPVRRGRRLLPPALP